MVNVRVNGQERAFDGDPIDAAHVVLTRRTWFDGDEIRLRRFALRRLYGLRVVQRRGRRRSNFA
jgi:hypothetical protein